MKLEDMNQEKKDKVNKIIFTIVSFLIIVGSIVGIYFMYQATYGKRLPKQEITITSYKGAE